MTVTLSHDVRDREGEEGEIDKSSQTVEQVNALNTPIHLDSSTRCIGNESLQTTGFSYTLSLINGKYKMTILYTLMEFGVVRFNEMKRYIGGISYKTLSSTLKELEADKLVNRKEYPQIPPKVEYSLTERGKSLIPILDALCEWGDTHRM